MAIEHKLSDIDSLPSLALTYLGDATRWKEIADYNKLSYPYLVPQKEYLEGYYGVGTITVTRANFQDDDTIKAGWYFKTKANALIGGIIKTFEVTEDVIFPAGVATVSVPLRSIIPGTFGNVTAYTVTEVGENTQQQSAIQFNSIYNEYSFTGGQDINVKVTGDTIFIPTDSSEVIPEDVTKMLEILGGSDLLLDMDGDLIINGSGDLASVTGADNIRYAVTSRIMTELGDLTLHQDYGTEIQDLIGRPNIANREKLMEVAILRALNREDRITEPIVDLVATEGTAVYLKVSYKIAITNTPDTLQITL